MIKLTPEQQEAVDLAFVVIGAYQRWHKDRGYNEPGGFDFGLAIAADVLKYQQRIKDHG